MDMVRKGKKATIKKARRTDSIQEPATEEDVSVRVLEGHKGSVARVVMPDDGSFALTSSEDSSVRRWMLEDEGSKSEIVCEGTSFWGLAVTGDGKRAAAGDGLGAIYIINFSTVQKIPAMYHGRKIRVGNLAFLSDGKKLLSAANDGFLRKWDVRTSTAQYSWASPFGSLFGVSVSADGNRIVGAAVEKGLCKWSDSETSEVVLKEDVAVLAPVAVTADGCSAYTGTQDGKVAHWDLNEGRRVAAFEGHSGQVFAVAVTPDGRFCVSGAGDGTVRLWAANTGQCLAIFRGHTDDVNSVAITSDAHRIASVSDDWTLRVWDIPEPILAREAKSRKRGYVNAKVVLLGESRVGKTGLALRLWGDKWKVTDSTHGMEIRRINLPNGRLDKDVESEVWLWDLAGQAEYRLTHQLFMEQTSLAVIVVDRQRDDIFSSAKYWKEALRKVTGKRSIPCILVAGRCDEPGQKWIVEEMKEFSQRYEFHGPILTAAKVRKHPGAAKLRKLIAELLPWDLMEFRSTMENFPPLKDAIMTMRDNKGPGGVVVTLKKLEKRIRKATPHLSFSAEDLRAVTGLLAGEGVLHALPYGDFVVMQPSWVNSYASILVKLAGEAENQLGHVPQSTIQPGKLPKDGTPRLSLEDEKQLLPALVGLILKRALAWKQDTDRGPMLVFPNYVRLPRPTPPPRPGHTVSYRFKGPLEEIYCTLVVRLHYSGVFDRTKLYRQAVDFQTDTSNLAALTMKADGERGELEIYFGEGLATDLRASFQRFVHDHLMSKATELERLRNFFCPECGSEAKDRNALDALITRGVTEIPCQYCFTTEKGTINLNDVLEKQFTSQKGDAAAEKASRRANEGISTAAMEQEMVGEVMALVASANQIYRIEAEPDEGVDGQIEFRDDKRRATGLTFRVQLKSGDSHLRKLKSGEEKFLMKAHYQRLWARRGTVPVLLIIRTSDGRTRYMNATQAIRAAQRANPGKNLKQLVFAGKDFNKDAILRLRSERLK